MRSQADIALLQSLLNEEALPVLFVSFEWSPDFNVSTLDIDYYFDGNLYLSREIAVSNLVSGIGMAVGRVDIQVANAERELSAMLLGGNKRGLPVRMYLGGLAIGGKAVLDQDGGKILDQNGQAILGSGGVTCSLIGTAVMFIGQLSDYAIGDDYVELKCTNEMIHWHRKTLRKSAANCPWPFGGTECGYSGVETWCNQTFSRCEDLGNTDNFGGDRFLPALQEQKVWWGRTLK